MHLGLIVGIGPAATDFYYRHLIRAFAQAGAKLELTMAHADTPTLLSHQTNGNAAAQVEIYQQLTHRLRAAGAETVAVTSIAGHFCIEEFKAVSPLPVIDLVIEVGREISARKFKKLGLIGTRVVMETSFYGAIKEVKIIAPPPNELTAVHEAYVAMASMGTITEAQRQVFFSAGKNLMEKAGVDAVMLAGTDLALAFHQRESGFPTMDCAAIHADAIFRAVRPN
jgi:aspartate racemase